MDTTTPTTPTTPAQTSEPQTNICLECGAEVPAGRASIKHATGHWAGPSGAIPTSGDRALTGEARVRAAALGVVFR